MPLHITSYKFLMHGQQHDNDIVRSVLDGNKSAYSILVDRYRDYVFTIINRLVPQREEAEDIGQEVFVKAYLSLAGFKGISKFSTWLYSIAHTTAISHLRKKLPRTVFAEDEDLASYLDRKIAGNVAENKNTTRNAVNEAIKQLAPADAEIITLFYLAEQTIEEIAVIINMEQGAIKVRLHRARQRLRAIIEQSYGAEAKFLYKN